MNIIEKLGITEIRVYSEESGHGSLLCFCNPKDVKKVEQQRNEMLEALIGSGITNHWFSINMQRAVENATGKTWEEIKELLNE